MKQQISRWWCLNRVKNKVFVSRSLFLYIKCVRCRTSTSAQAHDTFYCLLPCVRARSQNREPRWKLKTATSVIPPTSSKGLLEDVHTAPTHLCLSALPGTDCTEKNSKWQIQMTASRFLNSPKIYDDSKQGKWTCRKCDEESTLHLDELNKKTRQFGGSKLIW